MKPKCKNCRTPLVRISAKICLTLEENGKVIQRSAGRKYECPKCLAEYILEKSGNLVKITTKDWEVKKRAMRDFMRIIVDPWDGA